MEMDLGAFHIESVYTGAKKAPWDTSNWNHNCIHVTNKETGVVETFDFWLGGMNQIETEEDLLDTFICIISEAIIGEMSLKEYINEFGLYDDADEKVLESYRSYRGLLGKVRKIYDGSLEDLKISILELLEGVR